MVLLNIDRWGVTHHPRKPVLFAAHRDGLVLDELCVVAALDRVDPKDFRPQSNQFSQDRESITTEHQKMKTDSNTFIPIYTLPVELHRIIFSLVEDKVDVIPFGLTSQYFLPFACELLDDYFIG
ncbi:hypothetical protein GGR58DRAFT_509675 [Xylaria digitata]|nr:hypothetical protein GGR58DRAFT_509675 [Xylaria digitata]